MEGVGCCGADQCPCSSAPTAASATAAELVNGARMDVYGHPLKNHERIAAFWTVRLADKLLPGVVIDPWEVTSCMRLVKEARLMETPGHDDSLVDIPGYANAEQMIHDALREEG